jgi:hypothetical protein
VRSAAGDRRVGVQGVTVRIGGAAVTGPTPSMFRVRGPDGNASLLIGD